MAAVPGMLRNANQQLGGTGPDADKGKERTQFEKDRQGRMQGSGGDRPPVYKPKDDGERGGYVNRAKKLPAPSPAPKIPAPPLSPHGRKLNGTSAVHGMLPGNY